MEDETPTLAAGATEEGRREMLQLMGQLAPAYIRRAQGVRQALDALVAACRRQREEWLGMARLRLGMLHALAGGDWSALRPFLAEGQEAVLEALRVELAPRLRTTIEPTTSARVLRRALRELLESLERFNRRWAEHLARQDLRPVNEAREGYNKYYLLEKECAVRSPALARRHFEPLPPLTLADLEALVPPLPVPRT